MIRDLSKIFRLSIFRLADSFIVATPARPGPQRSSCLQVRLPRARPLPTPPVPLRIVPRRRASSGAFVDEAPQPPKTKKPRGRFYIVNPSESPISPSSPPFPPLALNVIPATPLPPPTPGVMSESWDPAALDSSGEKEKRHRRLARSVSSVPDHVLAELRGMTTPLPHEAPSIYKEPGKDESEPDDLGEEEEEEYSWVVTTATRVARPTESLRWVEELGGDRWIVDRYSSVLRAL
ncbi:hypothetical protein FB45DRAFT_909507 [Roridomyces roridus]|uniref:Uncharacterized protein n=1 Tax=Roridomyces roridus TaxID=1738132 RepID=A0AAD7BZ33_9AGAR|nr:hypothetical protein FB45DRAFT_909507 [Roridomyces roridus]